MAVVPWVFISYTIHPGSTSRSQERTPSHKPTTLPPALSFYPGRKELGCLGFVYPYLLPSTSSSSEARKTQAGSIKTPGFVCGAAMPHNRIIYITFLERLLEALATLSPSTTSRIPRKMACGFFPPSFADSFPPPLRILSPLPLGGFWRLHLYSSEASVSCSSTSGGKGRKFSSSSRIPALLLLVFSWRRLVS